MSITFIIPVGGGQVFSDYFLSSPMLQRHPEVQVLPQRKFKSAGLALNDGIDRAVNDVIVCAHQDVIFPATWVERFLGRLEELESKQGPVGVVGCAGITSTGKVAAHVYHRDRELVSECPLPAEIETLDELLVAFRKSSGLRFDSNVPGFFNYAPDICMEARSRGLGSFVVDVPVVHYTKDKLLPDMLPAVEYEAGENLIRKWPQYVPPRTLCGNFGNIWNFRANRGKRWLLHVIRYSPTPWWETLRQVDLKSVLSE